MASVPSLVPGLWMGFLEWKDQVVKTADYTLVLADNGKLFHTVGASGAVTFTLPALAANYKFGFFCGADQTLTVASVAGNDMIAFNDVAGSTVAFATSGEKVGGLFIVESLLDASKWMVYSHGKNTVTVT